MGIDHSYSTVLTSVMLRGGRTRGVTTFFLSASLVLLCLAGRLKYPSAASTLGLAATIENGSVLLTWNPNARPIPTATTAVLSITDAGRSEAVELNLTALRSARLAYRPIGRDVTFRLTVPDERGRTVAESVRIIMRGAGQAKPDWTIRLLPPEPRRSVI